MKCTSVALLARVDDPREREWPPDPYEGVVDDSACGGVVRSGDLRLVAVDAVRASESDAERDQPEGQVNQLEQIKEAMMPQFESINVLLVGP